VGGFAAFLNHWWNLPFLVMLGLVVVFFALQTVGIVGHDADADVDADADADADVDADADANADVHADAHADADGVGLAELLAYFGVGRVPFMVVWVTLFIFAGATGLFFNSFFYTRGGGAFPAWGFPASLGLSLAIGLVAVRLFSRAAARLVDVGGKGASTKHELAGKLGVVASARLDAKFGEVRVSDGRGNEILVHARLGDDETPLTRGDEVILVEYDGSSELFTATAGGARILSRVESETQSEMKPGVKQVAAPDDESSGAGAAKKERRQR
jgi:hypothetical protein